MRAGKAPLWSGHHEKCAFFHDNPARAAMHSIDRLAEQLEVAGVALPGRSAGRTPPLPDLSWVRPKLGNTPRLNPAFFALTPRYMLLSPGASAQPRAASWGGSRCRRITLIPIYFLIHNLLKLS